MDRALLTVTRCQSCRHELLKSILTVFGVPLPRKQPLPKRTLPAIKTRAFSSISRLRSDNVPRGLADAHIKAADEQDDEQEIRLPASETRHVPWYLQEDAATTESHPLSSGQTLPELPPNSPAILSHVLEYTFKDLGLDDLTLIDLRGLDTPPALGANVIMIIGTARSVKHLNVSADRLCRWLRSSWKLSPYADGLLGRNELKIKLRRKARRARIASKAGAMLDEKDDGITTGWICVNAGLIKDEPATESPKERNFEGFGETSEGSRIIVQIFTEEKRAQVDLDGLWNSALQRAERRKLKHLSEIESEATGEEAAVSESATVIPSSSTTTSGRPQQPPVNISFVQKRGLHSSRVLTDSVLQRSADGVSAAYVPPSLTGASSATEPSFEDVQAELNLKRLFDNLFDKLNSIPASAARQELGHGPDDRDSTLFLRILYDRDPKVSDEVLAWAKLKHLMLGISVQHPAFTKDYLWDFVQDYLAAGYSLDADLGMQILRAFLTGRPVPHSSPGSRPLLSQSDLESALRLLSHLSIRGINVLTMETLFLLYESITCASIEGPDSAQANNTADAGVATSSDKAVILRRIVRAMQALNLSFTSEQARTVLPFLFRNKDFDLFWTFWRKIPIQGSQRTAADYELLFRLHAKLGNHSQARDCLATWVPMMHREEPPVSLVGELARQVKSCIEVADPDVVEKVRAHIKAKQTKDAEHPLENLPESSTDDSASGYYVQARAEDEEWQPPPQKDDRLMLLWMDCQEALATEQDDSNVQYGSYV